MKVTVVIPAYNAETHLAEAIESVLNQTYSNFELIVINDGSQDNTLEILKGFEEKDSRVHIINQENQGIAESLNRGMTEAKTDWVAIMHADDVMQPYRLEKQMDFLNQNPDIKVLSCLAEYISATGKKLGKTTTNLFSRKQFQWYIENTEAIGLLHPGVILHKKTILSVGGYRQPFWPAEDIDLWNRVAEKGHLILVQDKVLMQYRIHSGSASTSKFKMTRMKYEWVRACMKARRAHEIEPAWDVFCNTWVQKPLWHRWNNARKQNAKALYHAAGHDCLEHNYIRGIVRLAWATILQPGYVFPRLKQQIFRL